MIFFNVTSEKLYKAGHVSRLFTACFIILVSKGYSQQAKNCKQFFKDGIYKYDKPETESEKLTTVVYSGNTQTEYFLPDKSMYIKSERIWLEPCRYKLKVLSVYPEELGIKPGEELFVKITEIMNGKISYVASFNGVTTKATLVRQ